MTIQTSPVVFLKKLFQEKNYSRVGLLVDENTEKNCYPILREGLPHHIIIRVKSGETFKTLATCCHIWTQFTKEKIDRHSLILILGGGVLGDMGGFCASTFKRGIDFVLIPTTLLAQVDASIGGKLGVNFEGYKNQIGIFKEPYTTLISPLFLDTLPRRVFQSGIAEIVKHCLIADVNCWNDIRKVKWHHYNWKSLIERSIQVKSHIVQNDPHEKGIRKIFNFGHTIGHAVERTLLHKKILHGEAIAIGMIAESYIAFQRNYIDKQMLSQITIYILSVFEKHKILKIDSVLDGIKQDKKNKGNKVKMTLIKPIGKAVWDIDVSEDEIYDALDYYQSI